MKKHLLTLLLLVVAAPCFAQIEFESGYFITNSGQKTDILIKNIDWKSNPQNFEYKASEASAVEIETLKNIKEFGVSNLSKFVRATVNIDQSSVNTSDLSRDKNPVYISETVFLRALIEGDYNLYEYAEGNMKKYFYSKNGGSIEPLVYKQYLSADALNKIMTNNTYQQQLLNDLKCDGITLKMVQSTDYDRDDLMKFFKAYNVCSKQEITYFQRKPDRNKFDLSIRPRLNSSSLFVENEVRAGYASSFDSNISFGIGLEAEFFLPYNKNKWSVFVEPTYQSYEGEVTTGSRKNYTAIADYKSVEVPVGLRHYMYLNQNSKVFLNLGFVFTFGLKSTVTFERFDMRDIEVLDVEPNANLALGGGYKFMDKYSIELRYQSRHILDNYYYWKSDFKSVSIIVGYTFM